MNRGPFVELTVALYRQGIKHTTAAKAIGINAATFQRRLAGKSPWTLPEMYGLTDLLNITTKEWGKMFPNIYKEDLHNG